MTRLPLRRPVGTKALGEGLARIGAPIPGLALAIGVAALSIWCCEVIGQAILGGTRLPVSPVMVAILLGLLLGNVVSLPPSTVPGLRFAVKRVLRIGIIMLGVRLSIIDVLKLGVAGLPVVLACVCGALILTTALAHWMRVPKRLGTLIGIGTSICGVSAILAAAPSIEAGEEEVAYAIGVITLFGLLATLLYPYLAYFLFAGNAVRAGLFLGTSVHDTSQVTGAAAIYSDIYASPQAMDTAVITKLVRNVFMVGVIPLMAIRSARQSGKTTGTRTSFRKLLPLFVLGFLGAAVLRSIGDLGLRDGGRAIGLWDATTWTGLIHGIKQWAMHLLVVALAAVGLNTRLRTLVNLGMRPLLTGLGAAILVGVISFVAVTLTGYVVGTGEFGT